MLVKKYFNIGIILIVAGCAHPSYNYDPIDEDNEVKEAVLEEARKDLYKNSKSTNYLRDEIVIFGIEDAVPEGYEIIQTIGLNQNLDSLFYDYVPQQKWRKAYCWPQEILNIATLTLWRNIPLYWPCRTDDISYDKRVKQQNAYLRAAVKAFEGDAVKILKTRDQTYLVSHQALSTTVPRNTIEEALILKKIEN